MREGTGTGSGIRQGGTRYPPVVKAPRWTYDTLKMFFLVSVCYDKKTRKENLLMADELRALFAPHLDSVLKKAWKKARKLAIESDMLVIHLFQKEVDDFDGKQYAILVR